MNIEEVVDIIQLEVKRSASFECLDMVNSKQSRKIFVFLDEKKFLSKLLDNQNISCVLTTNELALLIPEKYGLAIAGNPRNSFYELHNILATNNNKFYWKNFKTKISEKATISSNSYIAPKNVRIGSGTIIEPNVTILERSIIGNNVIIRAGSTIGTEGFEFKRIDNKILNVVHAGGVKIDDWVEIQANCAISKALFGGFTEIGEYTKLDNLVHIAHNVKIGKRTLIAASTTVSGSVEIGNDVWIGPSAVISNQINIGDNAKITLGSVVVKDVKAGQQVSGNFAIEHKQFLHKFRKIMKSK